MLALYGFLIIVILLYLVLTKKTSIHFSLVIVPIVFAIIAGFSFDELGEFMGAGLTDIAHTGIMLTFATLFFGIMFDTGMFDPLIKGVIRFSGGNPVKITIGTAIIAMAAHLDGSGASTFLITVSAMLPIYRALKMSPLTLAVVAGLAAGTMNMVPWGGPTIRAATALGVDVIDLYAPMIPVQIVGLICVLLASFWLGYQEKKKLGIITELPQSVLERDENSEEESIKRPKMIIPNLILTVLIIVALVTGLFPLAIPFVMGVPLALVLNYRDVKMQQERIEAHAKATIYTASIIFSAGIFTGVLTESGMIQAMADTMSGAVPTTGGQSLPIILAFLGMPLSLVFDPDSFYFGVLPVLSATASEFGIDPITMGRAAIIGQMTVGFPVSPLTGSTFLLIGLAGVDLGDLQKKAIPLAFGISSVMAIVALILGLLS